MSTRDPDAGPAWGTPPERGPRARGADPAQEPEAPEPEAPEPEAPEPDPSAEARPRSRVRRAVTTGLYAGVGAVLGFAFGFGVVVLPSLVHAVVTGTPDQGNGSDAAWLVLLATTFGPAVQGGRLGLRQQDPPGTAPRSLARRARDAALATAAAVALSVAMLLVSADLAAGLLLVTLPAALAWGFGRPYGQVPGGGCAAPS